MPKIDIRPIRVEGNVAYVPLTKGYEAVIDADDAYLVEGTSWFARVKNRAIYAQTNAKGSDGPRMPWMHRLIMAAPDGAEVDHIDGDGLNNRRANLRLATPMQNRQNRRPHIDNTSGFKGVSFCKQTGKWRASICANRKLTNLGRFSTPEEAYAVYCEASERLHGDCGRTA